MTKRDNNKSDQGGGGRPPQNRAEKLRRAVLGIVRSVRAGPGRLFLCCVREGLDVILFDAQVLVRARSPLDQLREYVRRAIGLLGDTSAASVAELLRLPARVVEMVLQDIETTGGATSDSVGRWSVANTAGPGRLADPGVGHCRRRLLGYWPATGALLPVLPSMLRQRDLVRLRVHVAEGEVRETYEQIRKWEGPEAVRRGKPEWLTLLPAGPTSELPGPVPPDRVIPNPAGQAETGSSATVGPARVVSPPPTGPPPTDSVLVTRCQLDVVALSWAECVGGVWVVKSRLWARPVAPDAGNSHERFAPGEPFDGLTVLGYLLEHEQPTACNAVSRLAAVFDFNREDWRAHLGDFPEVSRSFDGAPNDCAFARTVRDGEEPGWGLHETKLGSHVLLPYRLLPKAEA
jgi:hypothetical protein